MGFRNKPGGLPKEFYLARPELGTFKVDPKVYDFSMPSPVGDLAALRQPFGCPVASPVQFNLELARELFVGGPPKVDTEGEDNDRPEGT